VAAMWVRFRSAGPMLEVEVPSVEREAARDLVRALEHAHGSLMRGPASGVETVAAVGNRVRRREL
jgi:hypothetical protein